MGFGAKKYAAKYTLCGSPSQARCGRTGALFFCVPPLSLAISHRHGGQPQWRLKNYCIGGVAPWAITNLQKSRNSEAAAVQIRGLHSSPDAWVHRVGHGGEGPGGQVEGCRLSDMRRVRDHRRVGQREQLVANFSCGTPQVPSTKTFPRVPAQLRCRASTTFARRWRTTSAPRRSAHLRTNFRALLPAEKKGARALPRRSTRGAGPHSIP